MDIKKPFTLTRDESSLTCISIKLDPEGRTYKLKVKRPGKRPAFYGEGAGLKGGTLMSAADIRDFVTRMERQGYTFSQERKGRKAS